MDKIGDTSVFRVLFESPDQQITSTTLPVGINSVYDRSVGMATLTFDSNGQLSTVTGNNLSIIRQDTGASNVLNFTVDMEQVSALAVDISQLSVVSQDGSRPGTLVDYGIDSSGIIQGAFDNGITRPLGQVVLARFNNPGGLVSQENSLYREGPNSGLRPSSPLPAPVSARSSRGALELSNVDISTSFVSLITTSTSFSANTRVIATHAGAFPDTAEPARVKTLGVLRPEYASRLLGSRLFLLGGLARPRLARPTTKGMATACPSLQLSTDLGRWEHD